jgi:peptidoglycan/xylan/chitin deacetylase (PgdA/CDA1 family)
MRHLAANYEVVSVLDVAKTFENQNRKLLPPRAVVITFDDAYSDFEEYAWPILKHYRLPVTLFVATAYPDHPERVFWWDRVFNAIHTTEKGELNTPIGRLSISTVAQRKQAYKLLKNHFKKLPNEVAIKEVEHLSSKLGVSPMANCVLGWDSLRKLVSEGVTLGAHTRTHPIMNYITLDDLHNETVGSKQDLLREIGSVPQVFAYPSGIHNQDAVKAVEQAGFALAFTTERGINEVGHADRLRLRRINVGMRTTLPLLRAQLSSWTASLYPLSEKLF